MKGCGISGRRRIGGTLGVWIAMAAGLAGGQALADPWDRPIASHYGIGDEGAPSQATLGARALAQQIGPAAFTASDYRPGTVRHIVMFRYRAGVPAALRAEVTARFLHLVQDSRRPDGTRVIQSIETGPQVSAEGNDDGLEQAFLVTFGSEGDRNYFVGRPVVTDPAYFDPAHEAFKTFARTALDGVVVFDYPVALVATPPQVVTHRHHKRA